MLVLMDVIQGVFLMTSENNDNFHGKESPQKILRVTENAMRFSPKQ